MGNHMFIIKIASCGLKYALQVFYSLVFSESALSVQRAVMPFLCPYYKMILFLKETRLSTFEIEGIPEDQLSILETVGSIFANMENWKVGRFTFFCALHS